MWNAISLVQDLKSCRRVHFLRRKPLHHGHLLFSPTPTLGQDMAQGQFFKRSLTGLKSELSFSFTSCLTKAEEPSKPFYLSIAGGRIIGFIPFPRVLVLCEMQSVSSRIWTPATITITPSDFIMPPTTIDDNKFKNQQMNCTLFLGEFKIGLGRFQQSSKINLEPFCQPKKWWCTSRTPIPRQQD